MIANHCAFFFAAMQSWQKLLWPVGGVLALLFVLYAGSWWWRHRYEQRQPILFLIEQILWSFRAPLLMVGAPSLIIIAMGLAAGSQVSMILFVLLSTATVVGIGAIAWWLWPRNTAEGNLFDLIPIPELEWPAYENARDRHMRAWVEHKTKQIKADPPAFSGATFGKIALEISREAAQIYDKQTPLSVSLDDLLRGIQRTAGDLKILSNHLPLAGHFTLAGIERQIEFAIERGRLLYAALFFLLSFFNPGNLIRVALAFIQQKSPWEHLLRELQGWVYGHYTQRLGYHMALIHSRRKPPPPDALHKAFAEQREQRDAELRRQKLGWLAFLGLFGFAIYLGLQLINATLVFGAPALLLGILLLGFCAYGVWGMRSAHRWERLWKAILPQWSENPPKEGAKELVARQNMLIVLREHPHPPTIAKIGDAKELPEFYGNILLKLWQACYDAYRPAEETTPSRTSREFYLPQAFAGIEELCGSMHRWLQSSSFLPSTIRQLERFGLNLETLYSYILRQSHKAQAEQKESAPSPAAQTSEKKDEETKPTDAKVTDTPDPTEPKEELLPTEAPISAETVTEAPQPSASSEALEAAQTGSSEALPAAEETLPAPISTETTDQEKIPTDPTANPTVWQRMGNFGRNIGNKLKGYAIGYAVQQLHQRVLKLLDDEVGERLINIYGARYPRSHFEPKAKPQTETRYILLLSREPQDALLNAIAPLPPPSSSEEEPTDTAFETAPAPSSRILESPEGELIQLEFFPLPKETSDQDAIQAITDALAGRNYHRLLLIDTIDYGAKDRIARLIQQTLIEPLRASETGSMALTLVGVEKLKPLTWDPPYDDYLQEQPTHRKSQRIRNAVLAWAELFKDIQAVEAIYPVGIPEQGEHWGLISLRKFLGLGEGMTTLPLELPPESKKKAISETKSPPTQEAPQEPKATTESNESNEPKESKESKEPPSDKEVPTPETQEAPKETTQGQEKPPQAS